MECSELVLELLIVSCFADLLQDKNRFVFFPYGMQVATSSLASAARLPWGSRVSSEINQDVSSNPPLRLQLFEFGMFLFVLC